MFDLLCSFQALQPYFLSSPTPQAQLSAFAGSAQASENDASSWISASSTLLMSLIFPVPNQEGGASARAKLSDSCLKVP